MTHHYQCCIEACSSCMAECEHCTNSCLQEQDIAALAKCITLNRDCAAACYLAVRLMESHSKFAQTFCRLCADICQECTEECRKHKMDHCQKCAEECQRCADECRKMSSEKAAA